MEPFHDALADQPVVRGVDPDRAEAGDLLWLELAAKEPVALVRWLRSDGRLRTDEELVQEMIRELGFQRRGARIQAAVRRAIERVRSERRAM